MSSPTIGKPASALTLEQLNLFGRKFKIDVALPSTSATSQDVLTLSSSDFDKEALRATFNIEMYAFQAFWYADVCVYNLDQNVTQAILATPSSQIKQGMTVTVSAGYQNGQYGVIWSGPVFQPLWEREDTTTFKITLHCILGLEPLTRNYISSTLAAKTNQSDVVRSIANQAFKSIPIGSVSSNLNTKEFPRGKVIFGQPSKYLSQVADDNNMQWWLGPNGMFMGKPDEDIPVESEALVITPKNGLIGTPQQTQYGVAFRTLLDPRFRVSRPFQQVKIDQSAIRLLKKQVGQLPSILDQDGIYIIGGLRFLGDTRGQEWYSEVVGYTSVQGKLAMMQAILAASLNGG